MKIRFLLVLGLSPVLGGAQAPATPPPAEAGPAPSVEGQLRALIQEAEARNPDLARARSLEAADRERIPQARALPDPTVTLGLQNDGFKGLQVGRMETSYYQVMATQGLPWPGKRGLRGEIAALGADASRTGLERTRLSLEADVKRAYFGLLLVRGQRALLERQGVLLRQAEATARVRYEVGQGAQADLLRAQLENTRLEQARLGFASAEAAALAGLNRLRGADPDEPLATEGSILDVPVANVPVREVLERGDRECPELASARLGVKQAEKSLDLARLGQRPDFAVSAGLMPRGGLDPMWYAGVSVSVPLWSKQKQSRAVAEQEWRRRAQGSEAESVRNLLAQRTRERAAQLEAALGSLRIYREALLVQSEASFQAALAQFEAGRAPFLGVLESLNGWTADQGGLLQVQAQAQALQIAQEEFNLAGTPAIAAPALASGPMGAGGAQPGAAGPNRPASPSAAAPGGDPASSMPTM